MSIYDDIIFNESSGDIKQHELDVVQKAFHDLIRRYNIINYNDNKSNGLYYKRKFGSRMGEEPASKVPDAVFPIISKCGKRGLVFMESKSLKSTGKGYELSSPSGRAKYIAQCMNYHYLASLHNEETPIIYFLTNEKQYAIIYVNDAILKYLNDKSIKWSEKPSSICEDNPELIARIIKDIIHGSIRTNVIEDITPSTMDDDIIDRMRDIVDGSPCKPIPVTNGNFYDFALDFMNYGVIKKVRGQRNNLANFDKVIKGDDEFMKSDLFDESKYLKLMNRWDISHISEIDYSILTNVKPIRRFSDLGIQPGAKLTFVYEPSVKVMVVDDYTLRWNCQNWSILTKNRLYSFKMMIEKMIAKFGLQKWSRDGLRNPMIMFKYNEFKVKDISLEFSSRSKEFMKIFR